MAPSASPLTKLWRLLLPPSDDGASFEDRRTDPKFEDREDQAGADWRLVVRRLAVTAADRSGAAAPGDDWCAARAAPRVLVRLTGAAPDTGRPGFGAGHAWGLAALACGTRPSALLERVGWRAPRHVLVASGEDERRDILDTLEGRWASALRRSGGVSIWRLAEDEQHAPSLPRWGRAVRPPTVADVRREVDRRRARADARASAVAPRPSDLLLVVRGVERIAEAAVLDDVVADGSRLGMHLLATVDDPRMLSAAELSGFDTRIILPGACAGYAGRLLGAASAPSLAAHEALLAQFPPREPSTRYDAAEIAPAAARPSRAPSMGVPDTRAASAPALGRREERTGVGEASAHDLGDGDAAAWRRGVFASDRGAAAPAGPIAAGAAPTGQPAPPPLVALAPLGEVSHTAPPTRGLPPRTAATVAAAATSPRLELRCFGGFSVRCEDRELSNAQREREWAILGYLACQPATGVPRDVLVETIWPADDDPGKAHRLGQCLYRLRSILGAQTPRLPRDLVRVTRQGVCRLDRRHVWSDAQEFLALLEAARGARCEDRVAVLERARRLVGGPLFRRQPWAWLDERGDDGLLPRERFRTLWLDATWELVEAYRRGGRPELAIVVLRDSLRQQPTDTRSLRALFQLMALGGDRLGLAHAYNEFVSEVRWWGRWPDEEWSEDAAQRARACAAAAYEAACALLARREASPTGRPERP